MPSERFHRFTAYELGVLKAGLAKLPKNDGAWLDTVVPLMEELDVAFAAVCITEAREDARFERRRGNVPERR